MLLPLGPRERPNISSFHPAPLMAAIEIAPRLTHVSKEDRPWPSYVHTYLKTATRCREQRRWDSYCRFMLERVLQTHVAPGAPVSLADAFLSTTPSLFICCSTHSTLYRAASPSFPTIRSTIRIDITSPSYWRSTTAHLATSCILLAGTLTQSDALKTQIRKKRTKGGISLR